MLTDVSEGKRRLTVLQQKFVKSGFDSLEDEERIELLLSLVLPQQECIKLAKDCTERFKSIRGFLTASPQELKEAGITLSCMFTIKLLHELPAAVLKEKIIEKSVYSSPKEVFDFLQYSMQDLKKEVFKVIYLNNRNQIIDAINLFEGTLDNIPVRPRDIVESAINRQATRLIFAHNHPAGDPTPSKNDKQLTRDLVFVGMVLEIKVLDHIIIGDSTYFSFVDAGLIEKYEDNFLNMKMKRLLETEAKYFKNL